MEGDKVVIHTEAISDIDLTRLIGATGASVMGVNRETTTFRVPADSVEEVLRWLKANGYPEARAG